jgi:hypothetical protein
MKLGFFAACSIAWLVAAGCSLAGGEGGGGGAGGGAGGAGGVGGPSGTATSGSTGTVGSSGTGGQDAGVPCSSIADCGNFGSGCIHCAITTACADAYQTCFDDPSCVDYATCLDQCAEGDDVCAADCVAISLEASVAAYEALIGCVLCDQCADPCGTPSMKCETTP